MAYKLNTTYLLFSHGGTGKCLNVYNGVVANRQNVCLWSKDGTTAENWTIKAFGSNYKIVTDLNQNYALNYYWSAGQGNPGACNIYPQAGNDADSSVVLEPVSTDVYRIKLKNYNLYLTAKGTGDNADVRWEAPVSLGSDYTALAPQEWRFVNPAEKGIRAPFIYTGYIDENTMYSYTDSQLSGLNNATEFVICSGVYNEFFTPNGEPNPDGHVQRYVEAAADMAKRLYTKYGKQVWIGTPLVGSNVTYSKTVFEEVGRRMTYFIDNIVDQFGLIGLSFDTVVKGIYMSDEGVLQTFDTSTTVANNWQISMFQTVSNYAAAKGKKMLWSPYWSTQNLTRAACVIHRTNIFDYALIQPNYYFSPDYSAHLNCEALRTAIAIQRVCYQTGQPILHESSITCSETLISCQMEIDRKYAKESAYQQRYKTYEDVFNQSAGAYDKFNANFGFYFECPRSSFDPSYDTIRNVVNAFFQ